MCPPISQSGPKGWNNLIGRAGVTCPPLRGLHQLHKNSLESKRGWWLEWYQGGHAEKEEWTLGPFSLPDVMLVDISSWESRHHDLEKLNFGNMKTNPQDIFQQYVKPDNAQCFIKLCRTYNYEYTKVSLENFIAIGKRDTYHWGNAYSSCCGKNG